MSVLTGIIEKIEEDKSFSKMEVTLKQPNNKFAFVDFRGDNRVWLETVQNGDTVQIAYELDGRISKASGTKFNNVIAKTLLKL